jgi:gas vesicle protein
MSHSEKLRVSNISNGIIGELKGQATFYENLRELVFDKVKDENLTKYLSDKDNYVIELVTYNETDESSKTPESSVKSWRTNPILAELLAMDEDKENNIDIKELRLSVNSRNCYSADRLKKLDFLSLKKKHGLNTKAMADISGLSEPGMYAIEGQIKKGTATFMRDTTRVHMTILAKYFERIDGVKSSLKDEVEHKNKVITECVEELQLISAKKCLIQSGSVDSILKKLKELI